MNRSALWCLGVLGWMLLGADAPPRVVDPRLNLTLFAEHPQIVTPTGIDVDSQGRVWALESNTHFPPDGYQGHPSDRLLVLQDPDGDGRSEQVTVFADGFRHAMSVVVRPTWFSVGPDSLKDVSPSTKLQVYVATRREVVLLTDDDGDLKADRRETLVKLDTPGDYPHNGLAGFALEPTGWLFFGFGENLGAEYKIIGSDGQTLSGGGEGGSVYRCRPDGSQLSQWSTGFWNPHASCVDAFGRLFTVDNDPDSRPPCRLLHLIPGGDYGYRFRNGRKGLHPFTAWNGELPGTLPMVGGTGEAPSGIIAYEADGLPEDYRGDLLVGSWGDHRIDRFRLQPRGASFVALAEPIVSGGENFRPVGLAVGPDGAIYFTDWVLRDYKLHSQGRIWKLTGKAPRAVAATFEPFGRDLPPDKLVPHLASPTLPTRRLSADLLSRTAAGRKHLVAAVLDLQQGERSRLEALWGLARSVQRQPDLNDLPWPQGLPEQPFEPAVELDAVTIAASWLRLDRPAHAPQWQRVAQLGYAIPRKTEWSPRLIPQLYLADTLRIAREQTAGMHSSRETTPPPDLLLDPFLFSAMADRLASSKATLAIDSGRFPAADVDVPLQTGLVVAARRRSSRNVDVAKTLTNLPAIDAQRLLVQWIAEEKLTELRPSVAGLLDSPGLTADLFLSVTAALEMLDGKAPQDFDKTPAGKYVLPLVLSDKASPAQAIALRLADPNDPALTAEIYQRLLQSSDRGLRTEAVRTLQWSPIPQAEQLLRDRAGNMASPVLERAEAVVGLARFQPTAGPQSPTRELLSKLLKEAPPPLRREALRSWRGTVRDQQLPDALAPFNRPATQADAETVEQLLLIGGEQAAKLFPGLTAPRRPDSVAGWQVHLKQSAVGIDDVEAGRRTFFHPQGPGCFKCHRIDGRGGQVGPDLSTIARTMSHDKLIESLLEPSREIAPQFVPWTLELTSGKTATGLLLSLEQERLRLGLIDGQILDIPAGEIEARVPQTTSLMPDKLVQQMTVREVEELLAFLQTLK